MIKKNLHIVFGFFAIFIAFTSSSQDLEPRSLSSIPIGVNFAIASYGCSSGNILLDNSLPIEH